jgi:hypothetical protein
MPIPLILGAALAGAAGSVIGNQINANATNNANQDQIGANLDLYKLQRADALTDWDKQNSYNSPAQQMRRFKEAGLNPNLIYGQMTNAPVIRSTDAKAPNIVAPRIDPNTIGNTISQYYDLKQQDLTIQNQEKALALTQAQTNKVEADAKYQDMFNQKFADTMPYQYEESYQKSRLVGKQVDNIMADIRNKDTINPLQQQKIAEEIKTIINTRKWDSLTKDQQIQIGDITKKLLNARIDGTLTDNMLKQYEYKLITEFGLNKNFVSDLLKIGVNRLFKN